MYQIVDSTRKFSSADHATSHDCVSPKMQNELISMLTEEALNVLLGAMKRNKHFGLIGDEGENCDKNTVLSMAHRTVEINLNVFEFFMGVFVLFNLKAETIAVKLLVSS